MIKLDNFRITKAGMGYKREVLLCIGSPKFCEAVMQSAAPHAAALFKAQMLPVIVPIKFLAPPLEEKCKVDEVALADLLASAAKTPWSNMYRALGFPKMTGDGNIAWDDFVEAENQNAKKLGRDLNEGFVPLIRADDKFADPIPGMPDWELLPQTGFPVSQ